MQFQVGDRVHVTNILGSSSMVFDGTVLQVDERDETYEVLPDNSTLSYWAEEKDVTAC